LLFVYALQALNNDFHAIFDLQQASLPGVSSTPAGVVVSILSAAIAAPMAHMLPPI
jgi:hypothetical protein